MKFAVDVGGTFTDLVVEDRGGRLRIYKAPTTQANPVAGVLHVIELAAADFDQTPRELLRQVDLFVHATTRAVNAILTGTTSRTAFLTTRGHPDILLFREGGRIDPFDWVEPFPEPYIPRRLTFEVPERIASDGGVVEPIDENAVVKIARRLAKERVEAAAVCLLWSIVNPSHERRVGELLAQHLPDLPVTLSHRLNTSLREFRRASSTCIDASLKPIMSAYLRELGERLRELGFQGRLLGATSQGGLLDLADLAEAPIRAINSGPAMSPVAGAYYARSNGRHDTVIVADAGGTSYDVSLVSGGRIPWTREHWIGDRHRGHMTGFPAVDVRSIGAGGGSIAWVDDGGMLHVGPKSAGADPGPACYRLGGAEATVTDAALVLGYIDPSYFLGGAMPVDVAAAKRAIDAHVGRKLGISTVKAAAAVFSVITEHMVHAIEHITINQGIDPREAVLIGGGGAAGLNAIAIARRLRCRRVVIPEVGAVLSAVGALMSDLVAEYRAIRFTTSTDFAYGDVNDALAEVRSKCRAYIKGPGKGALEHVIEYAVEARYPHQVWEIEVPVHAARFRSSADLVRLIRDFHETHMDMFGIKDADSPIEFMSWNAKVRCRLRDGFKPKLVTSRARQEVLPSRRIYLAGRGWVEAAVYDFEGLRRGTTVKGPAIVESAFATVVVDEKSEAKRQHSGSLAISIGS